MIPLRLVIDTNIVVSAALKPAGLQRTVLLLAITKPARLYVSDPVLASRPELKIRKGLQRQHHALFASGHPFAPSPGGARHR
jgi:predicted nucleic acid-binding protein